MAYPGRALTTAILSMTSSLTSIIRKYPALVYERLSVATQSQSELATLNGFRFSAEKIFSNFDTGTPLYILVENPEDSGYVIGFQERILKTDTDGITNFSVLWDYDVSTATKTTIPAFNQNNYFRLTNIPALEFSVLNSVTVPSPDIGDWAMAGSATIADEGIERESDFIPTSGVGSNTSGDVSNVSGLRLYWPGTGALIKIVSDGNDNRVKFGYDWLEIPIDRFDV